MTTHTPGPWVEFSDQGETVAIMPAGRDGDICVFAKPYPSRADARLIAASPDMLAALTKLDEWWTEDHPGGPEGASKFDAETLEIWHQIRAAIAAATGANHEQ